MKAARFTKGKGQPQVICWYLTDFCFQWTTLFETAVEILENGKTKGTIDKYGSSDLAVVISIIIIIIITIIIIVIVFQLFFIQITQGSCAKFVVQTEGKSAIDKRFTFELHMIRRQTFLGDLSPGLMSIQ